MKKVSQIPIVENRMDGILMAISFMPKIDMLPAMSQSGIGCLCSQT